MSKLARIALFIFGLAGIGAGSVFFLFLYAHTGMNEAGEASLQTMFTQSEFLPGALVSSTIVALGLIICIGAVIPSRRSGGNESIDGRDR